jgi:hypothetical protein
MTSIISYQYYQYYWNIKGIIFEKTNPNVNPDLSEIEKQSGILKYEERFIRQKSHFLNTDNLKSSSKFCITRNQ